jgi:hypothetical protein
MELYSIGLQECLCNRWSYIRGNHRSWQAQYSVGNTDTITALVSQNIELLVMTPLIYLCVGLHKLKTSDT